MQYPEDQVFERSVFREVSFGPRAHGLGPAEVARRVRWALRAVGLDPVAFSERSPFTLSGGELRRVALASILSVRPRVLILDEPTAGLDPLGRRELLAQIEALQRETGLTLILVSHDVDEIARTVSRIVLLKQGRLVADGDARSLLSDPDRLRAAGLRVSVPVALMRALEEAGWPVRTDCILPEEAADEIQRVRRSTGAVP
jgi:energy-coupling factor transport system ATP-binding protein